MNYVISSKQDGIATTNDFAAIEGSHGTVVRPSCEESFFVSHHKGEASTTSPFVSSSASGDTALSSSSDSGSSISSQGDDEGVKSESEDHHFDSGPHRALEVPNLVCWERENPIEARPNPEATSSSPWSSSFMPTFYSPERMNALLPPSSQLLRMGTNTRCLSAPVLTTSPTAFRDSLPKSGPQSNTSNYLTDPHAMSSSTTLAGADSGSAAALTQHLHLHQPCSHDTVVTELLEDFFFGGKRIPTESYELYAPLDSHSCDNSSQSCCERSHHKQGLLAPASPTTVTATCFCADESGGPEQQPLLENNNSMVPYGATMVPSLPDSPKPPPSPQQIQRRTIFQRSSMPHYPSDVVTFRRPFAQRSNSLSSLPSSATTKICSNSHQGHYFKPLSNGRRPSKPALKRCSSLGKGLPQHGQSQQQEQQQRQPPNKVSFGTLQFREYDIALSDHPGCSYGPPIQLGWEYGDETTVVTLEDYERHRIPRRSGHQLVLSGHDRRYCLQTAGYSKAELQKAVQEVEKVKRQRLLTKATDKLLVWSRLDEFMEHCVHWVQGLFFCPPPPQQQIQQQGGE